MRILIFHPALAPYTVDMFNALAEKYTVKIVFLHDNLLSQQFNQQKLRSRLIAEHVYLTNGFMIYGRTVRVGAGREITRFKPEVVVTNEYSPVTIAVAMHKAVGGGFRHVVFTDDNPALSEVLLRKFLRKLLLPRLDGIVFKSDETTKFYRDHYGFRARSASVPYVRPEDNYRMELAIADDEINRQVVAHGLSGKRVALYVGRLVAVKRIDRLIAAFAAVAQRIEDAMLVLVGDGNERPGLAQLASELGIGDRIIFAGRHEGASLMAWYRIGGVFALTSEFEPFGTVVNEALLAGMPVVCSDRAGARILIQDQINGTIVNAEDKAALEKALSFWLSQAKKITGPETPPLRPSLMKITFQEAMANYDVLLQGLAGSRITC